MTSRRSGSFDIIEPHDVVSPSASSSSQRERSGAVSFVASEGPCLQCHDTQLALMAAQEINERLLRGLSRIISHLDQANEHLKSLEVICHRKERVPDHIHLPAEDVYIIDPQEIAAKRKENMELGQVVDQMYPKGLDYSDIEEQISKLDKCLKETRETCISSANVCFEGNPFGGKKERPSLKRMNTVHSTSFSQSYERDEEDAGGIGKHMEILRHSLLRNLHSQHSEHRHRSDSAVASLRRTRSEAELDSVLVTSLILEQQEADPLQTGSKTATILSTSSSRGVLSPSSSVQHLPFRSHLMSVLRKQETRTSITSLAGGGTLMRKSETEDPHTSFVQPLGKGLTGTVY